MALSEEVKNNIFSKLKKALEDCCPPMVIVKQSDMGMELMGNKPVPYGYSKKMVPGMYFSSAVVRKDMISFYFFPIYGNVEAFSGLAPTLFKSLKGKTCFNFKKAEQVDEKELAALLNKGVEVWIKMGYMKD